MLAAMNPKGGCDVSLRQTPDRAGAADGDPCRRLGTDGRQSTGSQQSSAAGEPAGSCGAAGEPAGGCGIVEARATRGAGVADRTLSRRIAGECAGGINLSAGNRAGRSLAQGPQDLEG